MKLKLFSVSAALCASLFLTQVQPGQAQLQALEPADPQWMTDMYDQGWQKVAEGVLRRSEGEGSPVESFYYNEDGLRWYVQQLQNRLSQLEGQYSAHPSADLAQAIANVEQHIDETNARINSGQVEPFTGEEMANCTINYGASADAHWLTGSTAPGVTANASAHFSSNCGHYGKVVASVEVTAVNGSVTTFKVQTDDRPESTSASAYAAFSASGSTSCHSYAVARTESPALNIFHTVEDHNYNCPPPPQPPQVYVSGQTYYNTYYYGPQCTTATWNANVSGGTPGYTINWYIGSTYQGSGSSLSLNYCYTNANVTVTAYVTDSAGGTNQASYTSYIYYEEDPCAYGGCGCGGGGGYNPRTGFYELEPAC